MCIRDRVSIINLENPNVYQDAVKFEFYTILLIEDCDIKGFLSVAGSILQDG